MDEIGSHTTSYLRGPEVSRQIDRIIPCLCCIQDSEEGSKEVCPNTDVTTDKNMPRVRSVHYSSAFTVIA